MIVVWTEQAEQDIQKNLDYLEITWGAESASNFLDRVEASLKAVQKNPISYQSVEHKEEVHRFVINKYISLFYQVENEKLALLSFWDNRRNPSDLDQILNKK